MADKVPNIRGAHYIIVRVQGFVEPKIAINYCQAEKNLFYSSICVIDTKFKFWLRFL